MKTVARIGTLLTSTETLNFLLENGMPSIFLYEADCATNKHMLRFKRSGKRNEIFLTSKFGITPNGARGDPEYVKEQCAKSLERFGVDYIDLYYQHR